jgi:hypothetical protein
VRLGGGAEDSLYLAENRDPLAYTVINLRDSICGKGLD